MEVNSVKATPTGWSTKSLVLMISAAALVASLALAPAASTAGTPLAGESTSVTLKEGVVKFLTNAGVSVAPISPARAKGRTISFPVTGGNLDLGTGEVLARHSGGLRVSAGGVKIPLRSFAFGGKVGKRIILTGKAGGARLPLFSLDTKTAKVNRAGFGAKVTGIQVALTGKAAAALNQAFGVNLLSGGLVVGSSRTVLQPRVVDLKATGATKLVPSAGALSALTAAGVTPSAVGPATLGPGGFSFPVIGGRLGLDPLGGRIFHSGGIGLAEHSTSAELTDFTIRLDSSPDLTAKTPAGRASIATLDLSTASLKARPSKRRVSATGIKVKLTATAATLLNGAFGTPFAAGDLLGTASTSVIAR